MQVTKVLLKILGMKYVRVRGCEFEDAGLVIDVAPTTRIARCAGCGCRVRRLYDRRVGRRWRHLELGGMQVELRYDLRRVDCARCGVRVELVPWAEPDSRFTRPFEEQIAYLAQRMDRTAITSLMGIAWYTVGSIAARVVARMSPDDRLAELRVIGIDELSYRRHHKYVTIITDHDTGKVVWAREGKNADTLDAFFAELGPERCAKLGTVTLDMSQAYINSVKANAPQAEIVFDRFHVQRLAHDALDLVPRRGVNLQRLHPSAPQIAPHSDMTMMLMSGCSRVRSTRGSGTFENSSIINTIPLGRRIFASSARIDHEPSAMSTPLMQVIEIDQV
jgi:transposase